MLMHVRWEKLYILFFVITDSNHMENDGNLLFPSAELKLVSLNILENSENEEIFILNLQVLRKQ